MSEEKKSKSELFIEKTCGFFLVLVILYLAGVAMFGGSYKATEDDLKTTEKAQVDISNALFRNYRDFGRLEVRYDLSVHAYISKENYMSVPYPDRDKAISSVGKAWCKRQFIRWWYLPKVVLRDIQTG